MSATQPVTSRPMSSRPASRAGVVDADVEASARLAAGERDRGCAPPRRSAARCRPARRRPCALRCRRRRRPCRRCEYAPCGKPERGHRIGHQREPTRPERPPREPHHRRIDVQRRRRSGRRSALGSLSVAAGRAGRPRAHRAHRVEQVGDAARRRRSTAACIVCRRRHRCDRRTPTTPLRDEPPRSTSSALGSSGAIVTIATPRSARPALGLGERWRPRGAASGCAPARAGFRNGPSRCTPERARTAARLA